MKYVFILFYVFSFTIGFAQTDSLELSSKPIFERKHELKLGAVKMLAGVIFETTYERILNKNSGYGASVLINFGSDNYYLENYSITPFYRMYFQTNEDFGAKGIFVEGFTSLFAGTNYDTYLEDAYSIPPPEDGYYYNYVDENFVDASIGLALGKKWINTAGFVFEIKAGAGRNLFGASEFDAIFKGDFYIGYRF